MIVYILTRYYPYEGEEVVECYSSLDSAITAGQANHTKTLTWCHTPPSSDGRLVATAPLNGGSDYNIYRLEVKP